MQFTGAFILAVSLAILLTVNDLTDALAQIKTSCLTNEFALDVPLQ